MGQEFTLADHRWRRIGPLLLALCWCAGLLCGCLAFLNWGIPNASRMLGAPYGAVSIVSLVEITLIPFLISAFAVCFSVAWVIYPVCFCKAVLTGFVSLGILHAFAQAGWLMRWLLLFSDLLGAPLLYGFWLRHLPGKPTASVWEAGVFLSVFALLGSVDYRMVSPFLASLLF